MKTKDTMVLALGVLASGALAVAQEKSSFRSRSVRVFEDPNFVASAKGETQAAGDSGTTCQESDQAGQGAMGTLAVNSDTEAGLRAADNFRFLTGGTVSQIEWQGVWLIPPPNGFADCVADGINNFTVRILGDDNGVPDETNVIFDLPQSVGTLTDMQTGNILAGLTPEIRWTFVLNTPIDLPLDDYHVEITNAAPVGTECFFFWETAPPGDGASAQEDDGDGDYGPDDLDGNDYDLAYCMTFSSGGAERITPDVDIFLNDLSDPETGCCNYGFDIENRNTPAPGFEITEFYLAVSKGDGGPDCEDLANVTPPPGFDVEFCEPWANGTTVLRFFGGFLAPQETAFGRIAGSRNGDTDTLVMARVVVGEDIVTEEQTILADGVRAWATQSDAAGACGSGNFSPFGTSGDWSRGDDTVCFIEPIPALGQMTKIVLACLFVGMGFVLVTRSRVSAA